ncbi:MAG: DUF2924 domain-containing protein [Brevinema sp.]
MEALYKKLTGKIAPDNSSPLWLKKQIEWYEQGGRRSEKEIRQMLALDVKKKTAYPKGRSCQSGTKLVREYEGKKHEVLILDGCSHPSHPNGCFIYAGTRYKSLSKIAEEITGTRWNGKVFFRLTESASARPSNLTQRTLESRVGLRGGNNG